MINDVTTVTREKRHFKVTLDETDTFLVPWSLFEERPLSEGDTVDGEEYKNWLTVHQYRYAMKVAGDYLSKSGHSSRDVYDRILRAGCLPDTAELVVYKLQQLGYLNDAEYAAAIIASRTGRRYGKNRIRMELRRKGLDEETARKALENTDEEALKENAAALAEKLLRKHRGEEPFEARRKVLAALVRRGYSWDEAKEAVESAKAEEE